MCSRSWDTDGDGQISLPEFATAMKDLGCGLAKPQMEALFKEWDRDGGGSIDYKEMQRILRVSPPVAAKGASGKLKSK